MDTPCHVCCRWTLWRLIWQNIPQQLRCLPSVPHPCVAYVKGTGYADDNAVTTSSSSSFFAFVLMIINNSNCAKELQFESISPKSGLVKQTTSQNLWPRINSELIDQLKPRATRFRKKNRVFRIFENLTIVARRREHFRGFLADFFVAEPHQKRGCFNAQEFTRLLSTGVVSASSDTLWRVLSNKVIRVFGHRWVDIPHIHTSEWGSLFF